MSLHEFKLTLYPGGKGGCVEMDGKPLQVTSITVRAAVNEMTRVTVAILAGKVEINGQAYIDKTALGDESQNLGLPVVPPPPPARLVQEGWSMTRIILIALLFGVSFGVALYLTGQPGG